MKVIINGQEHETTSNIIENVAVGTGKMNFTTAFVTDSEADKKYRGINMLGFTVDCNKNGNRLDTRVSMEGIVLFEHVAMTSAMNAIALIKGVKWDKVNAIWMKVRSGNNVSTGRTDGSALAGLTAEALEKMLAEKRKEEAAKAKAASK